MDIDGAPFLLRLLGEISRFGIKRFVLLSGHLSNEIAEFAQTAPSRLPTHVEITIQTEPRPLGTGGALINAAPYLDENFLLVNGDSWFDTNLGRFLRFSQTSQYDACILLRRVDTAGRYGVVNLTGSEIHSFGPTPLAAAEVLVNSGIYALRKDSIPPTVDRLSLESDIFPVLAKQRRLGGYVASGYFTDIGVPDDLYDARAILPRRMRRGAVFFDRDGVINRDFGWVGHRDQFQWIPGAKEAILWANDNGYHAFIVTNQAGIGKGLYRTEDLLTLHSWIQEQLGAVGATVDDWRWCPHHPAALIEEYRQRCDCRKPSPGMIVSLRDRWNIDPQRSLLIGDKPTDIEAATASGIKGVLYDAHVPLDTFLRQHVVNSVLL